MDATDINSKSKINWDFPQPFTLQRIPALHDIDGLNHTNNAVYVQWCETIGWAHSESLGLSLTDYKRLDRAMAIRQAEYDYLLPSTLGEKLILATWLTDSDEKLSMQRRFQLVRESDHAVIFRAKWHLVCIEVSTGKARRMPPEFCQKYGSALAVVPSVIKT
ncbi:acyl-CoA thioesterase [Undibacterium sp. Dicai25W]|uniref:acyl-CoA thioesterase n=1 Tax=Undibacterium sp. Dicai25W TaxID=3413034 RepID=UPI003BF1E362